MGTMEVPAHARYGASTARAVANFPISQERFGRRFLYSLALLKAAAAEVNRELGWLDEEKSRAIVAAAREAMDGKLDDHFVVDIFQTGSGTSTNMNANEVIAHRATELLGRRVHPNDDVNRGQSSNDVIPTVMQLSCLVGLEQDLKPALSRLAGALGEKSRQFWDVVKTGRTHLQDATPIRMGQVFLGFQGQIERGLRRLDFAVSELAELPLGGTAVGTGVNTHPEFAARVIARMARETGVEIRETGNHFQGQNNLDAMISASGCLRTVAMSLHKIANDIRFMGSGPRAGLGELRLPEVQPGSSIMPGKINPVIPEALIQVVAHVLGNDTAILHGSYSSYFELNMMMPMAAHNLNTAIELLASATDNFTRACVQGLEVTRAGPAAVERGLMLATALAPVVGYDKAAEIAKKAAATGRTIREMAREMTELSDSELERILEPLSMTEPTATPTGAAPGG
ncbi:MAG: class II fumarate hydratase [Armatimonadetes bacterium]|nr:class II fumarate hydratase [Armatimonadota bacterium]